MMYFRMLITGLVFISTAFAIESRITEVTLFADRALVTRMAEPDLPEGISELVLAPLPAWINPASIRAKISGGDVLDVSTRREFLVQTPDEDLLKLETTLQELMDGLSAIQDRKTALQHAKDQMMKISDFASGTLPAETLTRDIPVAYFEEMVSFGVEGMMKLSDQLRKATSEERKIMPQLTALRSELQELKKGNLLEQLIVTLRVSVDAGIKPRLQIVYELPGATWEVAHDVRIENDKEVTIVSLGLVRQTTGEDWENVKVSFSTRRPGQTATIPELETLLLGSRHAVNPVGFGGKATASGWSSANSYYLENNIDFNRLRQKDHVGSLGALNRNQQALMSSQRESKTLFKSLEERGTTALFEAEGLYTVRSDGNQVRIPYARVEQVGELTIMAAPEVSPNAARALELTYTHPEPLLPGNASLFLDGAYIGSTRLEFAGPGERFVLFAGSEDRLKLSRTLNHKESDLKRGRRRNTMKVYFEIEVENTGDEALNLKLADRIPVSDDKDIDVDHVRIEPEASPDESGLLYWETLIPANSSKIFTLQYAVDYANDLQLRRQEVNAMPFATDGMDAAPASARDQIFRLEKIF